MNELNLKDKVAVVTGGAGIICSIMAKSLAAQGVKTVILDLNKEAAVAVANEIENEYGTQSIGSSYRLLTKTVAYSAAKAAVNNFTQWLAVHFSKAGIRVNAIAPGFLLTDQNRFLLIDEETGGLTERGKKIINKTPMERYCIPEELTGTLVYLVSDLSKFVTGVVIPVDGGFNAYSGV